jgi:hypothetical protein
MAARFHVPQPHPARRRRPGTPALTLVPDRLAPVLPMPRPAARAVRLVLLTCRPCDLAAEPMPAVEAEHAAGLHDDKHHDGQPTAELHTDPRPTYALGRPTGGPDLGGAA